MEVERYLARLGGPPAPAADLDSLAALMEAHLQRIPQENLDIHLGIPIRLDTELFYDKIICGPRGGGCYELNGLFAELLRALGFQVDLLSARVVRPHRIGPEFDHLALRVSIDGRPYLVDVGFGDGPRRPLELAPGTGHRFFRREFKIAERDGTLALEIFDGPEFDKGYIMSPEPRRLEDFEEARRSHHEDPRSWFVRTQLATLATPNGRRTLMNERLKITEGEEVVEWTVRESEYLTVLRENFGIELSRVPRTKASWPLIQARAAALLWRDRVRKLLGLDT